VALVTSDTGVFHLGSFQAMQSHPITPLVRVPWSEPGIIGKVLDAGAYGVIAPMINNKAEAEAFVSYCKYRESS